MKHLLLLLFLAPIVSFSQCPDGTFTSQAEIDAFAAAYPDCTVLNSSLSISGDDVTDLSGLGQIVQCRGLGIGNTLLLETLDGLNPNLIVGSDMEYNAGVGIINNASLTDMSALGGIHLEFAAYGSFYIQDNPVLSSLNGADFSRCCDVELRIVNNDALTNLAGLNNPEGEEYLVISDNDNLVDFTGLGNIWGLHGLNIANNTSLQSLNGANIDGCVFDSITISNNPNLTDIVSGFGENNFSGLSNGLSITDNINLSVCNAQAVCYKLNVAEYDSGMLFFDIQNNASGCNTIEEIEYSCGLAPSNDDCVFYEYANLDNNYPMWLNLGEPINANNEFATTSAETPSCNDIPDRRDLWYLFNSGESTTVDISVQNPGYSLQLWEGGCPELSIIASACGSAMLEDIPVTPNTYYTVQVWSDGSGRNAAATGWFELLVQDGTLSSSDFSLQSVKVFPNPTTHQLTIQAGSIIQHLKVNNLLGQEVYHSTPNTDYSIIDTSVFSQGMYLVTVTVNGSESTYKIVKQ